jgi:hypothetical protein
MKDTVTADLADPCLASDAERLAVALMDELRPPEDAANPLARSLANALRSVELLALARAFAAGNAEVVALGLRLSQR